MSQTDRQRPANGPIYSVFFSDQFISYRSFFHINYSPSPLPVERGVHFQTNAHVYNYDARGVFLYPCKEPIYIFMYMPQFRKASWCWKNNKNIHHVQVRNKKKSSSFLRNNTCIFCMESIFFQSVNNHNYLRFIFFL